MLKVSNETVFQVFGAIVMIIGMLIFLKDQRTGETGGSLGPLSLKFTTPSLSFFFVGAILFVFPFTPYFRDNSRNHLPYQENGELPFDSKNMARPGATNPPAPKSVPDWLAKLRKKKEDIYLRLCDVDNEKMFKFEKWLGDQVGIEKVNVTKDTPEDTYTTWSYIDWGGSDQDIGKGLSHLLREEYGLDVPALPKAADTTGSMIRIEIAGAKCVDTSRPPGTPAPVKVIG